MTKGIAAELWCVDDRRRGDRGVCMHGQRHDDQILVCERPETWRTVTWVCMVKGMETDLWCVDERRHEEHIFVLVRRTVNMISDIQQDDIFSKRQ